MKLADALHGSSAADLYAQAVADIAPLEPPSLEHRPLWASALLELGRACSRAGDHEAAIGHLLLALPAVPRKTGKPSSRAYQTRSYLLRALSEAYEAVGQPKEAVAHSLERYLSCLTWTGSDPSGVVEAVDALVAYARLDFAVSGDRDRAEERLMEAETRLFSMAAHLIIPELTDALYSIIGQRMAWDADTTTGRLLRRAHELIADRMRASTHAYEGIYAAAFYEYEANAHHQIDPHHGTTRTKVWRELYEDLGASRAAEFGAPGARETSWLLNRGWMETGVPSESWMETGVTQLRPAPPPQGPSDPSSASPAGASQRRHGPAGASSDRGGAGR